MDYMFGNGGNRGKLGNIGSVEIVKIEDNRHGEDYSGNSRDEF